MKTGQKSRGGYTEKNLVNIDEEIQVDANTSGIKVAVKTGGRHIPVLQAFHL